MKLHFFLQIMISCSFFCLFFKWKSRNQTYLSFSNNLLRTWDNIYSHVKYSYLLFHQMIIWMLFLLLYQNDFACYDIFCIFFTRFFLKRKWLFDWRALVLAKTQHVFKVQFLKNWKKLSHSLSNKRLKKLLKLLFSRYFPETVGFIEQQKRKKILLCTVF